MFVRLKENIPCHSCNEPMKFFFGRGGFIELFPGELTQHGAEVMRFFAEFHLSRVEFVNEDGSPCDIFDQDGKVDFDKIVGESAEPKSVDFAGEVVKPKKLKTSASQKEINELIYGKKEESE